MIWSVNKTIFTLLFLGLSLNVTEGEPKPITLEEARFRALQNSPTLTQARLDEKAARWGMLGAVSDALPHVYLNSSLTRFDDESVFRQNIMRDVILQEYGQYIDPKDFPPFVYKNMYSSSVSVDQPIYNGGTEITALRIAGTRKKVIRLTREVREREINLQVEMAYYNLCRAYQAFEVQKGALEVSRQYLDRFRHRQELGLISNVDVLRWEVQAAGDEAVLVDAENARKLAELSLARIMGSPCFESYYPADLNRFLTEELGDPAQGIAPLDELWENARKSSPDLEVVKSNVDLEKQNVWLASANFQPDLNFNYTYSWEPDHDWELDGFESWTASVSLRMPLFASFGNVARWQEARINVKRAKESVRDFEMMLYMQLTAAYNDLLSAASRMKSTARMLQQASEVLSAQENRHELGMITTLELLDARTAKLVAEFGVVNARFDALVARANLIRIAGKIGQD